MSINSESSDGDVGCVVWVLGMLILLVMIVSSVKHGRQDDYILDLQRRVAELEQKR